MRAAHLVSCFKMDGQLEFPLKSVRRVAINVTQLVRMVRETLEANLDEYWVVGEISNARMAPSKHLYFTLKDARSAVSAVMFNSANRRLRFRVEDGMEVLVRGRVNLYEARGSLQFYAEEMEPRGAGALQIAFEQLKQRLGAEGLFDGERKRRLPFLPQTVGIVTAVGGAALRDMLRILLDRYPNLRIIVRPARVQGQGAAAEIAAAIADLNTDGRAEVIIAGRGGGSLEDLWAFNEELVARAIFGSAIPIVAAVGHEIDYTIADFVADLRAPTPTAAAQMVVPDKAQLRQRVEETAATLGGAIQGAVAAQRKELEHFAARLRDPGNLIRQARQRADDAAAELGAALAGRIEETRRRVRELGGRLGSPVARAAAITMRRARIETLMRRLERAIGSIAETRRIRLGGIARQLDAVSPLKVLDRGYALVAMRADGRVVTAASMVEIGDELEIRLKRGRLSARTIGREV